jgi:hypothetical protein
MTAKPASASHSAGKSRPPSRSGYGKVLQRLDNRPELDAVMDAVSSIDLPKTDAWDGLRTLATNVRVNGIEAVPEGIFKTEGNDFTAVATVYLSLDYGDGGKPLSISDSFPAQIQGHFESHGKVVVDRINVDTSAFLD